MNRFFVSRLFTYLFVCCFTVSTSFAQTSELDLVVLGAPAVVQAEQQIEQPPEQEAAVPLPDSAPELSFWTLLQSSGIIGFLIILLSLIAVSLIIEYLLSIRQRTLMPPGFAEEVLQMLSQGQSASAIQKCQNDSSALAQILHAGMSQYEFGWDAVEKSAEEATAEQASRLYRKVEYLNVIGNIAPMLGLLGTVVGMVIAFQEMSETAGFGRATDLAKGIYLALITTVEGLVVAIPCLAAHSFFGNRIATLISQTTFVAEQVLQPIKKNLLKKQTTQSRTG